MNAEPVKIIECGCCGHYHRVTYHGDCRNDDERFTDDDLLSLIGADGAGWVEVFEEEDESAEDHEDKMRSFYEDCTGDTQ